MHAVTVDGGAVRYLRFTIGASLLLADDAYQEGGLDPATGRDKRGTFEREHRNTFLYRSPGGHYFMHLRTRVFGEEDGAIRPVDVARAATLFEQLREKHVSFAEAFPGLHVEDA